eukprot:3135306-Pyramimonas_sp.AAC.1
MAGGMSRLDLGSSMPAARSRRRCWILPRWLLDRTPANSSNWSSDMKPKSPLVCHRAAALGHSL